MIAVVIGKCFLDKLAGREAVVTTDMISAVSDEIFYQQTLTMHELIRSECHHAGSVVNEVLPRNLEQVSQAAETLFQKTPSFFSLTRI